MKPGREAELTCRPELTCAVNGVNVSHGQRAHMKDLRTHQSYSERSLREKERSFVISQEPERLPQVGEGRCRSCFWANSSSSPGLLA